MDNLFDQLVRDEQLRLKPYRDTVGKLTIGIGRNLDDDGISPEEAHILCNNDIDNAKKSLAKVLPWYLNLDPIRQAVLVNMCFNMGISRLLGFHHFLNYAQAGQYDAAADEMKNSKWDLEVGDRAHRLEAQMRTGTWQ